MKKITFDNLIYFAIFLTDKSKKDIKTSITLHDKLSAPGPWPRDYKYHNEFGDHVTLAFKPDKQYVRDILPFLGREIHMHMYWVLQDDKCQVGLMGGHQDQGLFSRIFYKGIPVYPHLTLSTTEGTPPSYASQVILNTWRDHDKMLNDPTGEYIPGGYKDDEEWHYETFTEIGSWVDGKVGVYTTSDGIVYEEEKLELDSVKDVKERGQ